VKCTRNIIPLDKTIPPYLHILRDLPIMGDGLCNPDFLIAIIPMGEVMLHKSIPLNHLGSP
jgi:hypothetical protein